LAPVGAVLAIRTGAFALTAKAYPIRHRLAALAGGRIVPSGRRAPLDR
jgi:hypothetical protein